jgi:hypothetical protein
LIRTPAKGARILRFYVATESALHIIYSDGTDIEIPKDRGRFAVGGHVLTQESFLNVQIADDRQRIGWLADYMLCAQSYPCSVELVVYWFGHKLTYIRPPAGIVWDWWFRDGGKQAVVKFGFPHGDDTGAYALYDTKTGDELATFSPSTRKKYPKWLELRSSSK